MRKEEKNDKVFDGETIAFVFIYFVWAALMLVLRILLPVVSPYCTTVAMLGFVITTYFVIGKDGIPSVSFKFSKKNRRDILSACMTFSAGIIISIPLLYLGDFLCESSLLGYNTEMFYGDNFIVSAVFNIFAASVLQELFFRRIIFKRMDLIKGGFVSSLISALMFSIFFLDLYSFAGLTVMALILEKVRKKANSNSVSVSCSIIFNAIFFFFGYMLSIDNDGAVNMGAAGILGMIFTFASVGFTVLYLVNRKDLKERVSLIEGVTVVIILLMAFVVGCILTSL